MTHTKHISEQHSSHTHSDERLRERDCKQVKINRTTTYTHLHPIWRWGSHTHRVWLNGPMQIAIACLNKPDHTVSVPIETFSSESFVFYQSDNTALFLLAKVWLARRQIRMCRIISCLWLMLFLIGSVPVSALSLAPSKTTLPWHELI